MAIAANANGLELVQDWDKTFPKSDKVEHAKATFKNRFGITLAADVYIIPQLASAVESARKQHRAHLSNSPHFTS